MGKINKKENNIVNWKRMPIEDKILLVIESACYFLALGTLIAAIFVINRGSAIATELLLLCMFGLVGCGLSARSSRESFIGRLKLSFKINNKKVNELLKWN